jgi:hypothetical protein
LAALRYAKTLSDDITAVHVSIDPEETKKVQGKMGNVGRWLPPGGLESPYRLFVEPLLEYMKN